MKKNLLLTLSFFLIFTLSNAQYYAELRQKKVKYIKPQYGKIGETIYMGAYEVSQGQYLEFLNDLKSKGEMDLYNKCYPDSTLVKSQEPDFYLMESYYTFFIIPTW